jgi:hypothetical protein
MQVSVLEFPLVLGIVPLVLVVLVCWTECAQGGGPHERGARRRHFPAADASRGLRGTAYNAVALPEPLAHRWNGPHFYGNYWETTGARSELVGEDIWVLWRCSDREVSMRLRLPPQTRRGQLRSPRLGPMSLN